MNVFVFSGRLTADPKTKQFSGTSVTGFTVANNTGFGDKKKVNFFNCECWGKRGETLTQYFSKGNPILIEGELSIEEWEAPDGNKRRGTKVRVVNWFFPETTKVKSDEPKDEPMGQEVVNYPEPNTEELF